MRVTYRYSMISNSFNDLLIFDIFNVTRDIFFIDINGESIARVFRK